MIYTDFNPVLFYVPCVTKKRFRRPSIKYFNIAVSFDIETTSFYDESGEKRAYSYMWQMCFVKTCVYGRTLEEFADFINKLSRVWGLNESRRMIVFVHNLEFEFQFIRKYFVWDSVFARETRRPLYALTGGVEFRCSYMLTLLSLKNLAEQNNTGTYKLLGNLDYSLYRHSNTPIKTGELEYGYNDVRIVCDYITQEIHNNDNDITKIPLTKTGYVRRECRQALQSDKKYWIKYKRKIDSCQPDKDLFILLNKAYAGGYTHANSRYVGLTLSNIKSIDFASSYPTSMIFERFPWKFYKHKCRDILEFEKLIQSKCCVFEIAFENLRPKTTTTILSSSKCSVLDNAQLDNGRVLSADYIVTYLTDLDYKNMLRFYTWDYITIGAFYWSEPKPLPKPLIKVILDKYKDKTELKGVEGAERLYMIAKSVINGVYGMCCTNPISDNISYDSDSDNWTTQSPNIDNALNNLRHNNNTFLLYQWGVWTSAWSRYRLLQFVADNEQYVVYCDTDSIKYIDNDYVDKNIKTYNTAMIQKNKVIEKLYNYIIPNTSKGVKAWLGIFDSDGNYGQFKTLGAKRYCCTYDSDNTLHITVSGLSKKAGEYISKQDNPFDFFDDCMIIPADYAGKLTHTYLDDDWQGVLTDYNGNSDYVNCRSGVHLAPQPFKLTIVPDFKKLFTSIQAHSLTGKTINGKTAKVLAVNMTDVFNNLRSDVCNGKL